MVIPGILVVPGITGVVGEGEAVPSSLNRRAVEVPTVVYEQLQAEAKRDGRTVAQVAVDLMTDGRDSRQWLSEIRDELHENRIEAERMRRQVGELAELVRGLAAAHHGESSTPTPGGEATRPRRRTAGPAGNSFSK